MEFTDQQIQCKLQTIHLPPGWTALSEPVNKGMEPYMEGSLRSLYFSNISLVHTGDLAWEVTFMHLHSWGLNGCRNTGNEEDPWHLCECNAQRSWLPEMRWSTKQESCLPSETSAGNLSSSWFQTVMSVWDSPDPCHHMGARLVEYMVSRLFWHLNPAAPVGR